jgi:uncharacterized protein (TIGR02597 family)
MQQVQHARGWSFLPKLTFVITIGLITAATGFKATASTDVFTDPVGFITLNSVGNGLSYVSLGMTQIPTQRGVINTVAGQKLTTNNTLTPNQFIGPGGATQFFIEITSGPNAGLTDDIVSNDTAAVFTASDDSSEIAATETYKIYPHWTLNTALGAPPAGINGSNTQPNADAVLVWNPLTQQSAQYWYRTTSATPGWRDAFSSSIDRGTNILYIDQGIVIQRKIAGSASTILVGGVKLGPTIIPGVANGLTYAGMVYASGQTLSNTLLYTGNILTGVNGSNTQPNADAVLVWDPVAQGSAQYWFRTTSATPGWRDAFSSSIDRGTNQLPFGAVMVIQRKIATQFNYTAPAPY